MHIHLEDDPDQMEENTVRVTTLNELVSNLLSTFISEMQHFILLPFKAGHLCP
jgi:hypothetical protein